MNNIPNINQGIGIPGLHFGVSRSAYGVLKIGEVTLIVAGRSGNEMFCESYEMNSVWKTCASSPSYEHLGFDFSIVWNNRLVAKYENTLHVYEGGQWLTKAMSPDLSTQ